MRPYTPLLRGARRRAGLPWAIRRYYRGFVDIEARAVARPLPAGTVPVRGFSDGRRYPQHPRVGVAVTVLHGEDVLLVRRATPPGKGLWSLPGGSVELGETVVDAAVREVFEETNLKITLRPESTFATTDAIFYEDGSTKSAGIGNVASSAGLPKQESAVADIPISDRVQNRDSLVAMQEVAHGDVLYHYVIAHVFTDITGTERPQAVPGDDVDAVRWTKTSEVQFIEHTVEELAQTIARAVALRNAGL